MKVQDNLQRSAQFCTPRGHELFAGELRIGRVCAGVTVILRVVITGETLGAGVLAGAVVVLDHP